MVCRSGIDFNVFLSRSICYPRLFFLVYWHHTFVNSFYKIYFGVKVKPFKQHSQLASSSQANALKCVSLQNLCLLTHIYELQSGLFQLLPLLPQATTNEAILATPLPPSVRQSRRLFPAIPPRHPLAQSLSRSMTQCPVPRGVK